MATTHKTSTVSSSPRHRATDTAQERGRVHQPSPRKAKAAVSATVNFSIVGSSIMDIPGIPGAKLASGLIRCTDIPDLTAFTRVNPRAPRPGGAVPRAIVDTLIHKPSLMVLKNAGLYLLVGDISKGTAGNLLVELKDPKVHGLVNGGHTYAMIREVLEKGTPDDKAQFIKAFVPIHLYSGVPDELIVEMASGLNHTRQVQEASLEHLRGHYDTIKRVMDKELGGDQIAYFEGDSGTVPIGEVLAFIEMFNLERYPLTDNPYGLYAHRARVIEEASEDFSVRSDAINLVITKLPEILRLADTIRRDLQAFALPGKHRRATEEDGSEGKRILLPFLGERVAERLPNGWLYPILAAFRTNVNWDVKRKTFAWKLPPPTLLKAAAPELVAICTAEQRNAANKPEWVGKRESAYRQCKMQIDLVIQKQK